MTTENQGMDPYEAVIADLKAQRAKIDETIAVLTSLRSGAGAVGTAHGTSSATGQGAVVETAGMYLGMSIADATKKLLALRMRTMGNVDIARELQAGGLAMTSKDPVNTVGSVLTRRFNEVGDIVKIGRGIWGLKEWYPGRTFKPSGKAAPPQAEPERSEGEHNDLNARYDERIAEIIGDHAGEQSDDQ
jgi:DNA-directed RNA polymerase delta subunit